MSVAGGSVVAMLRQMQAEGLSFDAALRILEAGEPTRSPAAARQKRYRDKQRNERDVTRDVTPSPNDIDNSNPQPSEPEGSKVSKRRKTFDLPDWVPAEAWAAFEAMRKAMRGIPFTDAARQGIVDDLDRLRGEGHDPAKLLLKAVKRGWRGVFEGDDTKASTKALSEAEKREAMLRNAEIYDRMGRTDEAKEIRRKWGTGPPGQSIGSVVSKIANRATAQ